MAPATGKPSPSILDQPIEITHSGRLSTDSEYDGPRRESAGATPSNRLIASQALRPEFSHLCSGRQKPDATHWVGHSAGSDLSHAAKQSQIGAASRFELVGAVHALNRKIFHLCLRVLVLDGNRSSHVVAERCRDFTAESEKTRESVITMPTTEIRQTTPKPVSAEF